MSRKLNPRSIIEGRKKEKEAVYKYSKETADISYDL